MVNVGADIIVYAGQSNSVGRGIGPFCDSDASHDGRCFQVARAPGIDKTIIPMSAPLQAWGYDEAQHGHGVTFARLYAASLLQPGRSVIIVPAACGATSILQWLGLAEGNGYPLYGDMATRIRTALAAGGLLSRIVAWVEHQGESDIAIARDPSDPCHRLMPDALAYRARKLDLIDRVRSDFGMFPMLFGTYSDAWLPGDAIKLSFTDALIDACDARLFCVPVSASGVEANSQVETGQNPVHFSAVGQEELARRHFAAYCQMLGLTGIKQYPSVAQARIETIAALILNWATAS
jgi:hypothetical protein